MKNNNIFKGLIFLILGILYLAVQLDIINININVFDILIIFVCGYYIIKGIFSSNIANTVFPVAILYYFFHDLLMLPHLSIFTLAIASLIFYYAFSNLFGKNNNVSGSNFTASSIYINDQDIYKKEFTLRFCSKQIYFNQANINGDIATINLNASFSTVQIYIPKNWEIIESVDNNFGNYSVNGTTYATNKKVKINVKNNFSDIQIIYV